MSLSYRVPHHFQSIKVDTTNINTLFAGTGLSLSNASGDLIVLNSTSGSSIFLPKPEAGGNFHFIVNATSAAHVITASTSGIIAGSFVNSSVGSVGITTLKTSITNSGGSIGDSIKLVSDGTYWYMSGLCNNVNSIVLA